MNFKNRALLALAPTLVAFAISFSFNYISKHWPFVIVWAIVFWSVSFFAIRNFEKHTAPKISHSHSLVANIAFIALGLWNLYSIDPNSWSGLYFVTSALAIMIFGPVLFIVCLGIEKLRAELEENNMVIWFYGFVPVSAIVLPEGGGPHFMLINIIFTMILLCFLMMYLVLDITALGSRKRK